MTQLTEEESRIVENRLLPNTSRLERKMLGGHRLYCDALHPICGECSCGLDKHKGGSPNE